MVETSKPAHAMETAPPARMDCPLNFVTSCRRCPSARRRAAVNFGLVRHLPERKEKRGAESDGVRRERCRTMLATGQSTPPTAWTVVTVPCLMESDLAAVVPTSMEMGVPPAP